MNRADKIAWGVLAIGMGVFVAALVRYWGVNPGYADRALVLLAAGYAARETLPYFWARSPRPRAGLGLPILLLAGIAFATATFLLIQIGPRTLLLWWLASSLLLAAAGLIVARRGLAPVRLMFFPLLFPLFALPIPATILAPLQNHLQEWTTRTSGAVLRGIGIAATRNDFVLELPGGLLRVEEACSGVRSLTALTAIAAFVGYWRGFGPIRGLTLLALSVPVVLAVNVVRVVFSGMIQEWIGPDYIRDNWHEALGFSMVFVGLGLILAIAGRLGIVAEPPAAGEAIMTPMRGARTAAAVAIFVFLLTAWGAWSGRGSVSATELAAPLSEMAMELPGWQGEDLPVPSVVNDLLAPDVAVYRRYTNNVGRDIYVWAFAWQSGSAIRGYHNPDICWGNRGYQSAESWIQPAGPPGAEEVVQATGRSFRQRGDRQVIYYWNQEGRQIWTEADEDAARNDLLTSGWSGHRWVGDLLGAGAPRAGQRLQVVIVCPGAGASARRDASEVASLVSGELYRVCPWADPRELE